MLAIFVAAAVVCLAVAVVVALVAMSQTSPQATPQTTPQTTPQATPQNPATPATPQTPQTPATKPTTAGSKLPASCKVTGDAFGNNPRAKSSAPIVKTNVRATYHYFSPDYNLQSVACADALQKYSQKVMMYPWTAHCLEGAAGWDPARLCGRCIRVKNRATGASVIVRVVDSGGCSGPSQTGLDLDQCAFNAIDTNRQGFQDGHLMVDVEEVEC